MTQTQNIKHKINQQNLIGLFKELSRISGVSGREHRVAGFIRSFFDKASMKIKEDDARIKTGGNQGNLWLIPNSTDLSKPVTAFVAHMDTVRDTSQSVFDINDEKIFSSVPAQLGADNRWGLSMLLNILDICLNDDENPPNIIGICTVAEEAGMLGAKSLDFSICRPEKAIIFDSALRPGSYIKNCAGMSLFECHFSGKAAHSAVDPKSGISAILMAAKVLTEMEMFPVTNGIISNIGSISGGSATNLIPDSCTINGEIRGFNQDDIRNLAQQFSEIASTKAAERGGKVRFSVEVDFEPYSLEKWPELISFTESILERAGLKPNGAVYSGGSDANVLNIAGIPAVNLGVGAQNPHSDNEFVLIEDVRSCLNMISAFYDELKEMESANSAVLMPEQSEKSGQ
ncbi:MAG: M20/M25/M40 family metallo-hydrolase [Balneolales bacterium]|nr:M20/M25/M40 family metallo-hydrolase [Balneolales bacterium]